MISKMAQLTDERASERASYMGAQPAVAGHNHDCVDAQLNRLLPSCLPICLSAWLSRTNHFDAAHCYHDVQPLASSSPTWLEHSPSR